MRYRIKKVFLLVVVFVFIGFSSTKAQAVYDTLYSYPDTTTFYNQTVIVVVDIGNLAITFHPDTSWESYQIEKILCSTPGDGVNPGGWTYFFLSVGDGPEDSIIYVKQVFNDSLTFYPEIHTFILDTPVVINNSNRFYFSGSFVNKLSVSQFLDFAVPGQFAYWWSLQRWVENVPFYFNLKVVVKKNVTSVDDLDSVPTEYQLHQNYPNPFNPVTTISYSIKEAGIVNLEVFNILGQKVSVLVNEFQEEGINSVTFDASTLPSGVYLYQLQSGNHFETKKMILTK
ncbi:MAG: T9SS type A sorting domain-containing protein [Ignavibacteriaceae bacterium]